MPSTVNPSLLEDLVIANHILVNQGVLFSRWLPLCEWGIK